MPANISLGVSFDFPPLLTVGKYQVYQSDSVAALKSLEGRDDVGSAAAWAIIFGAAVNAGLLLNWRSHYMPTLDYKSVDDVHAFTVMYVAQEIHKWIEEQRRIDPKALWRRLIAWTGTERLRQSLAWRGVALASGVYRLAVDWLNKAKAR